MGNIVSIILVHLLWNFGKLVFIYSSENCLRFSQIVHFQEAHLATYDKLTFVSDLDLSSTTTAPVWTDGFKVK